MIITFLIMEIEITINNNIVEVQLDYGGKYLPVIGSIGRGKTIAEALTGLAKEVESVENDFLNKMGVFNQ